jgi:hypothetical protein
MFRFSLWDERFWPYGERLGFVEDCIMWKLWRPEGSVCGRFSAMEKPMQLSEEGREEEEERLTFILGVCQPRNPGCVPGPEAKKRDTKRRK